MGLDGPVMVSAATANNPREFYEENAKAWEALGEEAGKIKQKIMKYVTKQEQKTGWYQRELSYTPAKKEE
jgi:3-methyladenine DNA glycosylase Tag